MHQHEIMCGVAHFGAVQKQPDVFSIGVFAAFFEAVVNRVEARVVAIFAIVDALVHLRTHVFVDVAHMSFHCIFLCFI